jgi:hypothetical protein
MYFNEIIDPQTNRTKVRMVDTQSEYYQIARRYMLRLTKEDFEDPHELAKYAATAGINLEAFRKRFYNIVSSDIWQMPDLNPKKFPRNNNRKNGKKEVRVPGNNTDADKQKEKDIKASGK